MKRILQFFLLLVFLGGLPVSGWGQLLNTLYTHREIDFLGDKDELEGEGFDETQYRLIPHTDIFINGNTGIGFLGEKKNFILIKDLINSWKETTNQTLTTSNQFVYFRENSVNPYQIGINLDMFIFDYFGIGFTYTRSHYFSHHSAVSPPSTLTTTNYYNHTVGYDINSIGNSYQFSLMGRYGFGKGFNNNIYLVGGIGYTLATLVMSLRFKNNVNGIEREQEYRSTSHAFHAFTELIFKLNHFNFGFGLLLNTIAFSDYTLPDNPEITPQKYESIKMGPMLYFKVGFNL